MQLHRRAAIIRPHLSRQRDAVHSLSVLNPIRLVASDSVISATDREFVTSAKKNSRILTNFPKLEKFVKIRTKIR